MTEPFRVTRRLKSFTHASAGVVELFNSQHNARIHAAATVLVIVAGVGYSVSRMEWCVLILAMIAVWMAEALNTSLEYLADAVTEVQHPLIKKAKDAAAGAVLITAIGAAVIGFLIFVPYIFQ